MRKSIWIMAVAPVLMMTAMSAQAFTTCKQLSFMCPGPSGPTQENPQGGYNPPTANVPEPATLALFASGIGALGISVLRRRRNKD